MRTLGLNALQYSSLRLKKWNFTVGSSFLQLKKDIFNFLLHHQEYHIHYLNLTKRHIKKITSSP